MFPFSKKSLTENFNFCEVFAVPFVNWNFYKLILLLCFLFTNPSKFYDYWSTHRILFARNNLIIVYIFRKVWVTYRFLYAMHQNKAQGGGTITNDVLKFSKVIEFESSCVVICFSYIYLIVDRRRSFINLKSR